jgi:hypothetical protein
VLLHVQFDFAKATVFQASKRQSESNIGEVFFKKMQFTLLFCKA